MGKRSRRPLSLQNGDFGFPVIGARLGPSQCGTTPAGGKTEPPAALAAERGLWTRKNFWSGLADILFLHMSTFSLLAEASTLMRYIFEVELMHTFHVLEFYF